MILAYLKPRTQIVLAVLVPLVSISIGLFLVWPAVVRLREAGEELEAIKLTIEEKKQLIAQAEDAAQGRPLALAVALADEQEPIVFLRQLAAICAESRVSLASVRATTPPPLPAPPAGSAPPPNMATPAGGTGAPQALGGARPVVPPTVEEVTDQVTVEGTFGDVLSLLVRLEGFDRILSVSQCRIHTGAGTAYPRMQAVFTLSRFVAKPPSPATGASTSPPAPAR